MAGLDCLFEDDLFEIHPDHTLVTNIMDRVLPLIRYRMNDILTALDIPKHRPYQAIAEVAGRVESQAKFRNRHGSVDGISPHTINEILIPHLGQFRMRLRSLESFDFAVLLDPGISEEQKRHVLNAAYPTLTTILVEKEMDSVMFEIPVVDQITVEAPTGQSRLILNPQTIAAL